MKQISQLIREIIPVIIGILIALFINNWNEERKDKKYLSKIFSSIEKELKESSLDIERIIPKQQASVDTIDLYLNKDEISLYDIIEKINGIHAPTIKTNAWNAIASSKIELIEYGKLSALARIEERKENLILRNEKQLDFLFQNIETNDKRKKEIFRMALLDIINAEKELKFEIQEILENEALAASKK